VVIFVPQRLHSTVKKIGVRLIRELEKKLSGKHVIIIPQRTILSPAYRRAHPSRIVPRSRTQTAVHAAILEDVVWPCPIVGKRIRVRLNGSRILKVYIDPKEPKDFEHKLKSFGAVYKALTKKESEFMFPVVA